MSAILSKPHNSVADARLLHDPGSGSGRRMHDDTVDEYYYGHRTIIEYGENGRPCFSYRALTLDDFLEPEEGDVYMQGSLHTDDVIRLRSIFMNHLKDRENITVYCDMKMIWGIEGLKNPAPDISIIADVKDPEKPRPSFSVPKEGVSPFFVLEVVSPRYRSADTDDKPDIYRKAGVSEYIIADPGLKNNIISYTVTGYRLVHNRYVKMIPDTQGRISSVTTGVIVGVSESKDRLMFYNAETGEEILSDDEEKDRAVKAEKLATEEKDRAVKEKVRADQEKARAEEELRCLKAKLRDLGITMEENGLP